MIPLVFNNMMCRSLVTFGRAANTLIDPQSENIEKHSKIRLKPASMPQYGNTGTQTET